jgi:hypothetical protein
MFAYIHMRTERNEREAAGEGETPPAKTHHNGVGATSPLGDRVQHLPFLLILGILLMWQRRVSFSHADVLLCLWDDLKARGLIRGDPGGGPSTGTSDRGRESGAQAIHGRGELQRRGE